MARFTGFYVPGAIQVVLGSPVGPFGLPILIPNLPIGVTFPFIMSGRGPDEFATVDQNVDTVALEVGLDGESVFVVTFDRSGTLTLTVKKSSFLNIALSRSHNALRNPIAPLLHTIPVNYNDPFAVDKNAVSTNCVVMRNQPLSFGATEGENAWSLLSPDVEINHGARVF